MNKYKFQFSGTADIAAANREEAEKIITGITMNFDDDLACNNRVVCGGVNSKLTAWGGLDTSEVEE